MIAPAKIGKLLAYLSESCQGFKPSEQTAAVWADVLGDFSEPQLMQAARTLAEDPKVILPTTGLVVGAIVGRKVRVPIHQLHPEGGRLYDSRGAFVVQGWAELTIEPGETVPSHVTSDGVRHYIAAGQGSKATRIPERLETPDAAETQKYLRRIWGPRPTPGEEN